jgi:uncharacterized protein (TIGR03437 family)
VTSNGIPAPLLYSSDGQINAIAPFEIQGASTANVCVLFQGSSTNCITLDVSNTAPGIFSLPSGYGAAVNRDGTINSPQNPAAMGSIVSLYVTGLGPGGPLPCNEPIKWAREPVAGPCFHQAWYLNFAHARRPCPRRQFPLDTWR